MVKASPTKRHVLSRGMRVALRVGVTAVVLAGVVIGVGMLSAALKPAPAPVPPAAVPVAGAPAGDTEYRAGLAALASGDSTKAAELLTAAAAKGSVAAKTKLDTLSKPPTPPVIAPVIAPDAYAKPVADIASLLPATVPGYTTSVVETTTAGAIVSLQPASGGPQGIVSLVVLTVFDKKTPSGAAAYVASFKSAYPHDLASVKVRDVSGRFGTDGAHLAAVVFSRGRFAFEVVATSRRGSPRDVKTQTLQAAAAFAASRTAP
jgi:hypothetical protein